MDASHPCPPTPRMGREGQGPSGGRAGLGSGAEPGSGRGVRGSQDDNTSHVRGAWYFSKSF